MSHYASFVIPQPFNSNPPDAFLLLQFPTTQFPALQRSTFLHSSSLCSRLPYVWYLWIAIESYTLDWLHTHELPGHTLGLCVIQHDSPGNLSCQHLSVHFQTREWSNYSAWRDARKYVCLPTCLCLTMITILKQCVLIHISTWWLLREGVWYLPKSGYCCGVVNISKFSHRLWCYFWLKQRRICTFVTVLDAFHPCFTSKPKDVGIHPACNLSTNADKWGDIKGLVVSHSSVTLPCEPCSHPRNVIQVYS